MTELPKPLVVHLENIFEYKDEEVDTVEELLEILKKHKSATVVELYIYDPLLEM